MPSDIGNSAHDRDRVFDQAGIGVTGRTASAASGVRTIRFWRTSGRLSSGAHVRFSDGGDAHPVVIKRQCSGSETTRVWLRRVRVAFRGLVCWLAAIAVVAAGFIVPLLITWRVVAGAVVVAMGPPNHDLSDIGPVLIGIAIGAVAGLVAGSIGAAIASLPALALIGKSGVFSWFKRHRTTS
jgi:hypothetical protein